VYGFFTTWHGERGSS